MKAKPIIVVLLLALTALAGWVIVAQKPQAPELRVAALKGGELTLAQLRGKVVLVNFWATTCTTCVGEMPRLMETHNRFKGRGFETLAVAMDYDPPEQVKAFVQRSALPFTFALDTQGAAAKAFGGVRLTPTSYLIDKQGRIIQQYLGAPDFAKLDGLIDELLKQS
ncbi:MAG TPA: TlpA disulfide reductase family protein [Rhodocyclaceae bacterium]